MSDVNTPGELGDQSEADPQTTGTDHDIASTSEGMTGANIAEAATGEKVVAQQDPDSFKATEVDDHQDPIIRQILSSSWLVTLLAIVVALVVSAILICVTDPGVQTAAGYLFNRPGDFFAAVGNAVGDSYIALFKGAFFDYTALDWQGAFKPLTESLVMATPLILCGLGLAIAFRAGLFNIGAQGQVIMGAILGAYVGFTFDLPAWALITVSVLAGALGGAIWASIAGILKAKTGAHEVIVTIMLNWIAVKFLAYLLSNVEAFQRNGQPKSPSVKAFFPLLFGESTGWRVNLGFVIALVLAVAVWFFLNKSTTGMRWRAVGENPRAARVAGISVTWSVVGVMAVAGAFSGLAGATQIFGTEHSLTAGIAGSLGFDAITVALLGRSRPGGVVLAGLLFGALKAAGPTMQAAGAKPEIVVILQAVIVLLIAAPPLVRSIFFLPKPRPKVLKSTKTATSKVEVSA